MLITTYEPSADALASGTITAMRKQMPALEVYAFGGPKMKEAGATLLEHTTQHASVGAATLLQVYGHYQRLGRLKKWLKENPIDLFVPTDSPAANWSICKLVRKIQPKTKIIHLVAPQLWAWGSWRVRRLHRWSDHVLCLLPFEPKWFDDHQVPASYIGHPVFDPNCHAQVPASKHLPTPHPRLALLPGSRHGEIAKNWHTMLDIFVKLKKDEPNLQAVVAAFNEPIASQIKKISSQKLRCDSLPAGLVLEVGQAESVIAWSDCVLVASGTATLQIAATRKPMVAMYNTNRLIYTCIGQFLITTKTFTLPNLASESLGIGRVIPEFVPHFGDPQPIYNALAPLVKEAKKRNIQIQKLDQVIAAFEARVFSLDAARSLLQLGFNQ